VNGAESDRADGRTGISQPGASSIRPCVRAAKLPKAFCKTSLLSCICSQTEASG